MTYARWAIGLTLRGTRRDVTTITERCSSGSSL